MKILLLSILFSIFLLSNSFQSSAYTGTCNAGNITAGSTYTCNTGYTGSADIFYSIETTTTIADVNYNIALNSANNIVFRNKNGLLGATISNLQIHFTDYIGQIGATGATGATGSTGSTGATGASAYEGAVSLGYTGTIFEWFESLRGPIGNTGSLTLDFSQTGTLQINNILTESTGSIVEFDTGAKIPLIFSDGQGNYFVSQSGSLQLMVWLLLGLFAILTLIYVSKYGFKHGRKD